MKHKLWGLLVPLLLTGPSFAGDAIFWKTVEGWSVYIDPTVGYGCYVATIFEDDTLLRLGFDFSAPTANVYMGLGNKNWKSLEPGKDYSVVIQFDNNPVWTANAFVMQVADLNYLTVSTTDTNFVSEFSRKHGIRVRYQGRQVASLALRGSAAATSELLACQTAMEAMKKSAPSASAPKADPFDSAPPVKSAKDPFSL